MSIRSFKFFFFFFSASVKNHYSKTQESNKESVNLLMRGNLKRIFYDTYRCGIQRIRLRRMILREGLRYYIVYRWLYRIKFYAELFFNKFWASNPSEDFFFLSRFSHTWRSSVFYVVYAAVLGNRIYRKSYHRKATDCGIERSRFYDILYSRRYVVPLITTWCIVKYLHS